MDCSEVCDLLTNVDSVPYKSGRVTGASMNGWRIGCNNNEYCYATRSTLRK